MQIQVVPKSNQRIVARGSMMPEKWQYTAPIVTIHVQSNLLQ
jgi:hypothetical protein